MNLEKNALAPKRRASPMTGEWSAVRSRSIMRFPMRLAALLLLCGIQAFVLVGCRGSAEPLGTVEGQVTFHREPVPNAVVRFRSSEHNIDILAEADEQGNYRAKRSVDVPGLPPGTYEVAVTPPSFFPGIGQPLEDNLPPERLDIPQKYRSVETSDLTLTVKEGENPFDISMQSQP